MASFWDWIKENGVIDRAMPGGGTGGNSKGEENSSAGSLPNPAFGSLPTAYNSLLWNLLPKGQDQGAPSAGSSMELGMDPVSSGYHAPPLMWNLISGLFNVRDREALAAGSPPSRFNNGEAPPQVPPQAPPDAPADAAVTPPVVDPIADLLGQAKKYREAFAEIYGIPPKPDTSAYDAEVAKGKDRTKYLAQLALSRGLLNAGGGGWAKYGEGVGEAGQVYDEGFSRYQKALADKAAMNYNLAKAEYDQNAKLTEASIEAANTYRQSALQTEKDKTKQRLDWIDEYFKTMINAEKAGELGVEPSIPLADKMRMWRVARETGIVPDTSTDLTKKDK